MKLGTILAGCVSLALLWGGATRSQARDCNQNGVEDSIDLSAGTSVDCNSNGVPDECDLGPTRFDLETATHFAGGDDPLALALGDLDGDDHLDVVVAEGEGDSVFLQLGDGSGGFEEAGSVDVGDRPLWVVVADVDGDGPLDIVTANRLSDNVTVLWNGGDASFAESSTLSVDDNPVAVTLADFDGDGDLDLATANSRGDSVSIVERTGTRAFGTALHLTVVDHPRSIIAVDTDADGDLDLVTANQHSGDLSILSNTGGSFSAPVSIPIGGEPRVVVSGDIDFDGDADLVVTSGGESAQVSIQRNRGDGKFQNVSTLGAPGTDPNALTIGDLTQDGALDFVVAFEHLDEALVYLNDARTDGNVSFTTRQFPVSEVRAQPRGVALGDFTGSGTPDVITANLRSDQISLLTNSTTLPVSTDCNENGVPDECDIESGVSADCNENGRPDACELDDGFARDCNENDVLDSCDIASGRHSDCNENGVPDICDATTAPYRPEMADTLDLEADPADVDSADVDGDGDVDVILTYREARTISLLENDGHGRLAPGASFPLNVAPRTLEPVDLDGDGAVDLVLATQGDVAVLYNDGAGGYGSPQELGTRGFPTVADVDGDDLPDVVVEDGKTITLWINDGERAFSTATVFVVEEEGLWLSRAVAEDLDGDGDVDIATSVAQYGGDSLYLFAVWVFENQGGGVFGSGTVVYAEDSLHDISGAGLASPRDFDGDGVPELVIWRSDLFDGYLYTTTLARQSDGSYEEFSANAYPLGSFVDVDGDGLPDVVTEHTSGHVDVRLNLGDGSFAQPTAYRAGGGVADLNGDGLPELIGVIDRYDSPRLAIARNIGEGRFAATRLLRSWEGNFVGRPVVGDVDGDGDEDFIAIEEYLGDDELNVHENLGDGTFRGRSVWYPQNGYVRGELRLADLDGRGRLDVVLVAEELRVFLNPGVLEDFGQDEPIRVAVGAGAADVVLGDLDGDADLDIVVANRNGSSVSVFENQSGGSFAAPVESNSHESPSAPQLADLDGDGDLDVLTTHPTFVSILTRQGDGTLMLGRSFGVVGDLLSLRTVDLDGDGDLETLFLDQDTDTGRSVVLVFENLGSGVFAEDAAEADFDPEVDDVEVVDLDTDGAFDLVARKDGVVVYARNLGGFEFATAEVVIGGESRDWRLADLEGDGDVDVLLLGREPVTLHLNDGDAHFSTSRLSVGASAIADFDGDGLLDLLSSHDFSSYDAYTLAPGVVASPFSDDCNADGTPDSCQLEGNDCDASGVLDVCEIASGATPDCNADGVPDSCQLDGNDCNGNGIPDDCDGGCVVEPLFQRGDCNGDGEVSGTVTDAVYLLNFNFGAGPRPGCLAACDANGDGEVIGFVTDAVYMLRFSFLGGPRPPAPHPDCGEGTASDASLGCETVTEACGGG